MQAQVAEKPRLLFVDDERRVLNSMRAMFRRDYELFLTTRGDEALKIIAEQPIDVLVADQRMPIMTGVELLTAARRQSPRTVRILLTGYSDAEATEGAMTDGKVFRFLNKPCAAAELRRIIAEAVQISRAMPKRTPHLVYDGTRPAIETKPQPNSEPVRLPQPRPSRPVASVDEQRADEAGFEVDQFAETTTMEIVMSGDTITVLRHGETAPDTYPPPPSTAPPATAEPGSGSPGYFNEPDNAVPPTTSTTTTTTTEEPKPNTAAPGKIKPPAAVDLDIAPSPSFDADPKPAEAVKSPRLELPQDSPTLMLYLVGAVLAMLAAAWLLLSIRDSDGPVVAPLADSAEPSALVTAPPPVGQQTLAENLELAAMAQDAGALIAPPAASALRFYLDARAQAPADPDVIAGLAQLSAQIDVLARQQLAQADFAGLLSSLDALATIDAADPRLSQLRADAERAVEARLAIAEAAGGDWDAATAAVDEMATLGLADPARISAAYAAIEAGRETAQINARARAAQRTAARNAAAAVAVTEQVPAVETASQPVSADSTAVTAEPVAEEALVVEDVLTDEQLRINELFASATASLDAGRLAEPAGDDALGYLQQIQQVEPDNPRLVASLRDLAGALIDRATANARAGAWDVAEIALTQAESLGVAGTRVARVREQILAGRIASESAQVIPMREMQPRQLSSARYPVQALREGVEGWALLHFTVQPDGSVTDIETVETSGRYGGRFARAARSAAEKWEFEPRLFMDQPIAQRVEARVKFELSD